MRQLLLSLTLLFGLALSPYTFAQEATATAGAPEQAIVTSEQPAVGEVVVTVTEPSVLNPGSSADQTKEYSIDLSGLFEGLSGILYAVLAFAAVGIYNLLRKIPLFNKLVTQEQYQKLLDPILDQAVAFGVGRLDNADWTNIETKNEALATAVNYVLDHGGDLLKKFGISKEALQQKLEAKLVANGWDVNPGKWEKKEQA